MPYKDLEKRKQFDHSHWEKNKEQHREAGRKSYQKYKNTAAFKERNRINSARRRAMVRQAILVAYGNKCGYCGYDVDSRALDLDHINNDGSEERKRLKAYSLNEYVFRNNFPPSYQLLCRNCNWLKYLDNK